MGRISHRVAQIAESATLAVEAKAKALKAAGEDVIGFGAGEPDFPTPEHIVEAAAKACREPRYHKYTPTPGLPELREAIAAKTVRDSGYAVDAAQVVVTNGGKHALFNAFSTLLDPGDEAIIPAPYWVSYPEAVRIAGGTVVEIPTDPSTGFRVSVDRLEEVRTERTKLLVFVSPSNPTGALYPPEEVEAIGRWAAEHDVWVICDEIYEHLVYDDNRFVSMPVVCPEIADRCIVVNGVAKTYAMTGWRVGWLIAPPDAAKAAANLQSHCTSNVNNVAQAAVLAALEGGLDAFWVMKDAFDRRRKTMHGMLCEIPGVSCFEPQGAFYCFPSLQAALGKSYGGREVGSVIDLAEVLLDEVRVAIVPGEAFGAPGYARLSYALDEGAMVEGVGRIAKLLAEA